MAWNTGPHGGIAIPHADTPTSGLTRLSSLNSIALDYPKPNEPFMFSVRYT
jgi:Flp pilus assembly CpaF family ATPase